MCAEIAQAIVTIAQAGLEILLGTNGALECSVANGAVAQDVVGIWEQVRRAICSVANAATAFVVGSTRRASILGWAHAHAHSLFAITVAGSAPPTGYTVSLTVTLLVRIAGPVLVRAIITMPGGLFLAGAVGLLGKWGVASVVALTMASAIWQRNLFHANGALGAWLNQMAVNVELSNAVARRNDVVQQEGVVIASHMSTIDEHGVVLAVKMNQRAL